MKEKEQDFGLSDVILCQNLFFRVRISDLTFIRTRFFIKNADIQFIFDLKFKLLP